MYHIELRKFPHSSWRFNQVEEQVRAIAIPWVKEEWFDEGDRRWNSNEATLTILEGPKLSMPDLAMGKGWRNAQRRSEDVTERVLASVRPTPAQPVAGQQAAAVPPSGAAGEAGIEAPGASQLLADSLGLELLGMLDTQPLALSQAWRLAAERLGDVPAAQSLALGELAVRSLVGRGLVVLREGAAQAGDGRSVDDAPAGQAIADERLDAALRAVESWGGGESSALQIARRS